MHIYFSKTPYIIITIHFSLLTLLKMVSVDMYSLWWQVVPSLITFNTLNSDLLSTEEKFVLTISITAIHKHKWWHFFCSNKCLCKSWWASLLIEGVWLHLASSDFINQVLFCVMMLNIRCLNLVWLLIMTCQTYFEGSQIAILFCNCKYQTMETFNCSLVQFLVWKQLTFSCFNRLLSGFKIAIL